MFLGVKNVSRNGGGYVADVVVGENMLAPGGQYFIMTGREAMCVARVEEITYRTNPSRCTIYFVGIRSMDRKVKEFAERLYLDTAKDVRTYADSAGTNYATSTMDAATAINMGLDRDVGDLAGGRRQRGYSIGDMLSGLSDDDL